MDTTIRLILDTVNPESWLNFYYSDNYIKSFFRQVDSYFYYKSQRIFTSTLNLNFFASQENLISISETRFLVLTYVSKTTQNDRLMYNYFNSFNTNVDIFYLPLNWYSTNIVYTSNAALSRAGDSQYNILSNGKTVIAWVKERKQDDYSSGGSVPVLETPDGQIIKKLSPDSNPLPDEVILNSPTQTYGLLIVPTQLNNNTLQLFQDDLSEVVDFTVFVKNLDKFKNNFIKFPTNFKNPFKIFLNNIDYLQTNARPLLGFSLSSYPTEKPLNRILNNQFDQTSYFSQITPRITDQVKQDGSIWFSFITYLPAINFIYQIVFPTKYYNINIPSNFYVVDDMIYVNTRDILSFKSTLKNVNFDILPNSKDFKFIRCTQAGLAINDLLLSDDKKKMYNSYSTNYLYTAVPKCFYISGSLINYPGLLNNIHFQVSIPYSDGTVETSEWGMWSYLNANSKQFKKPGNFSYTLKKKDDTPFTQAEYLLLKKNFVFRASAELFNPTNTIKYLSYQTDIILNEPFLKNTFYCATQLSTSNYKVYLIICDELDRIITYFGLTDKIRKFNAIANKYIVRVIGLNEAAVNSLTTLINEETPMIANRTDLNNETVLSLINLPGKRYSNINNIKDYFNFPIYENSPNNWTIFSYYQNDYYERINDKYSAIEFYARNTNFINQKLIERKSDYNSIYLFDSDNSDNAIRIYREAFNMGNYLKFEFSPENLCYFFNVNFTYDFEMQIYKSPNYSFPPNLIRQNFKYIIGCLLSSKECINYSLFCSSTKSNYTNQYQPISVANSQFILYNQVEFLNSTKINFWITTPKFLEQTYTIVLFFSFNKYQSYIY